MSSLRGICRIAAAALLVAAPLVGVGSLSGSAYAAGLKIKCTAFTYVGAPQYTGCTSAATGGSSVSAPLSSCTQSCSATIDWANGDSTSWTYNLAGGAFCGNHPDQGSSWAGTVTQDNTGFAPVGGEVTESLCQNLKNGHFHLAPNTVFTMK